MQYTNLALYFFSGTGNTYRTATWLVDLARRQGIEAEARPIDMGFVNSAAETGANQLIGLLAPTHAFCAPWAMISFALRLPRAHGQSAFTLLTRGGMKIGKAVMPGLEGSGAYLLALILALKGYRMVGARGLDLPVSWTVIAPGYSRPTADIILAHARPRAEAYLQAMLEGKKQFLSILPLILGLLLSPITLAYLVMGRFWLAKLFYAAGKCNGCGLCAKACPVQAIRMRRLGSSNGPRPYWTFLCESCTRCMNYCPKQAVEASYPFGALAFYVANIPLAAYLLDLLARWVSQAAGLKGTLAEVVLNYPYKLLSIALAYLLFVLALRIPYTNRLLTLLTPTHYYRRYTSPGTKLTELKK